MYIYVHVIKRQLSYPEYNCALYHQKSPLLFLIPLQIPVAGGWIIPPFRLLVDCWREIYRGLQTIPILRHPSRRNPCSPHRWHQRRRWRRTTRRHLYKGFKRYHSKWNTWVNPLDAPFIIHQQWHVTLYYSCLNTCTCLFNNNNKIWKVWYYHCCYYCRRWYCYMCYCIVV